MPVITYRKALNDALAEELARDENVFIIGEEVAHYNGAYKVTEGLWQRFGDKRVFNGKMQSQHYGVDLDGAVGAPIIAAQDGEVVLVRHCYTSGRTVLLYHGAGVYSAYFHMSRTRVRAGQRVRRGQRIGDVGKTGRVTGPHLHFSMRVDGLYVDPASVLALDLD